jgi:hypothetical protein
VLNELSSVAKKNHINFLQNLSFRIIEDPTEQSLTLLLVNIIKLKAGLSNSNKKEGSEYQWWVKDLRQSWRWSWQGDCFFPHRNHRSIRSWMRDRSCHRSDLKMNPLIPETQDCLSFCVCVWWLVLFWVSLSISKKYSERNERERERERKREQKEKS